MSDLVNKELKTKIKSRGTTIVVCPYDKGLIIASDKRATDTNRFEVYTVPTKIDVMRNGKIFIGGAGAAVGTDLYYVPFTNYLDRTLDYYKISLEDIQSAQELVNIMNKLNVKYLQNLRDTLSIQLMDSVQFIVGINTKKLNFAYTSDFAADASFRTSTLSMHGQTESKDIQAIGSGGRYIIGFLLKENQQKRLSEQTRDQVIEILKRGFKDTCGRDLASFCREGIATWTLQKGGHSYFEDIAVPT